jgi:hypothetical protein
MTREGGSAMVLAVLVVVILTLLGTSFLLIADTENRIAENERLSAQALYFAEGGVRAVVQWFDHPGSAENLVPLDGAAADRTARTIDDDGDPATPPHPQDGSAWPRYKQDVDSDADGADDLFERPYRDRVDLRQTLLGTEDGPDVRVRATDGSAAADFLARLSEALMAGYPSAGTGIRARVHSIEVYAPPYLRIGGVWTRFGIATVKVVARISRTGLGPEQLLAERHVKAVLNEVPYGVPFGPLHSCAGIAMQVGAPGAWGTVTAVGGVDLDFAANHARVPAGFPRVLPPTVRADLLWGFDRPADVAAYGAAVEAGGGAVDDPWFRLMAGQGFAGAPSAALEPFGFGWLPGGLLGDGQRPAHAGGLEGSHANIFQFMPLVSCPEMDYTVWKSVATSGRAGVEYYVWSGSGFRRDGLGPARSFRDITDLDPMVPGASPTLYFFDTTDARAPHDDDGDGAPDNLTPDEILDGGTWSARGFIFLNARSFRAAGVAGRPLTLRAPGEPFQDADQDGVRDAGEVWINLRYPGAANGAIAVDSTDARRDDGTTGGAAEWNASGPPWTLEVSLGGILALAGRFDASGTAVHAGSIVARGGVEQSQPGAGAPRILWNDAVRRGEWPPEDWPLPRVLVSRWETDP